MDRGIPCANKIIFKKINDRNRQIHLQKLNQVKSSLSRDAPSTFNHLRSNKKKNQLYEEKLTEIERENRILLEKLTHIMKTSPHAPQKQTLISQGQSVQEQPKQPQSRSLNKDYRKRELVKITIENQQILKRLKDKKSTYTRSNWMEERRKNERYLKNISEYPLNLYSTMTTKTQKSPTNDDLVSELNHKRPQTFNDQPAREDKFFANNGTKSQTNYNQFYTGNPLHSTSGPFSQGKKRPQRLEPMAQTHNQKEILYQTKKKIGFSTFLVHIYLQNKTFNILASNNDRADFKSLSLPESEGKKLLERFQNNYEFLINQLKFQGNKILLEDFDEEFEEDIVDNTEEDEQQKAKLARKKNKSGKEEGGIVEIQDDNDENDSFEQSENRAKQMMNSSFGKEDLEEQKVLQKSENSRETKNSNFNREQMPDRLVIPEESQKDETESNIRVDQEGVNSSKRDKEYEKQNDDNNNEEEVLEENLEEGKE